VEKHDDACRRLEGKVALITGAGGNNSIGRSVALRFSKEGARVAVTSTDGKTAAMVADEIAGCGGEALALACDVVQLDQCEAAAAKTAEAFGGRIDILVNNAGAFSGPEGASTARPFDKWTPEEWDHIVDVNLRGMWFCVRAVHPYMKPQGYGKIINVSSTTVWKGLSMMVPYVASKAGVIGLTRSLARALGPEGIRVNTLVPGFTLSDMNLAKTDERAVAAREHTRLGQCLNERNEVPDDLAGPALFLASADSDFVTGQSLLVDGGFDLT
jgi:3-oxoacyl-[acyl-carrier protein] reductase